MRLQVRYGIARHTGGALSRGLALLTAVALLGGCSAVNSMFGGNSATDALSKVKWNYAENAIELKWRADGALNSYDGQPHALLLTVVQMSDPNVFKRYASNAGALGEVLTASVPPAGILALNRVFVQPDQTDQISLPRAENAQYVGVVSGYYTLDAERVARLYRIGVGVDSHGLVIKNRSAAPTPLEISLVLGPMGLLGGVPSPQVRPPPQQPKAGEVPLSSLKNE
ncbi:type VI secretion system lipoprotein TssJ [Paraburkholderia graminis]|uniref:Type VI secretion system VasD/TssJ family lipoprotein n=1 Tax=Paraburkholderia graminis TaxID=60548 RepID=A0ABD5CRZ6_9BURK|nr:type VI secretion system lipoprotein TssJ [Paraburkholderia graminis]MDR6208047.1 type VI secretion system VasD/TssJ family lipoprotein [Paraburkholderia graminis]